MRLYHNLIRWRSRPYAVLWTGLLVSSLFLGVYGYLRSRPDTHTTAPEPAAHDEHTTSDTVRLTPEAIRNVGIRTEPAQIRPVTLTITTVGAIGPDETRLAHLRPLSRGRIQQVFVRVGDRVRRGQPLLIYDNIELGELVGAYLRAVAEAEVARRYLERAEQLVRIGALAQAEYDQREARYREAMARVQSIELKMRRFGLEPALLDWQKGGQRLLFPSPFTSGENGIPINGLIWMGDTAFMKKQIREKLENGFRCIKLKIGAIDFEQELALLKMIRNEYPENELELRVDANGAFSPEEAMEKLEKLSHFQLHSIEQPVRQGQWDVMSRLCRESPVPIALDEDLIGLKTAEEIEKLLTRVQPQYIVLKPSLLGGFAKSRLFIALAGQKGIGWWVTSALEGNIGLNAIAQWTFLLDNPMPQGLGTGQLFKNNVSSPLYIEKAQLKFDTENRWDLNVIASLPGD